MNTKHPSHNICGVWTRIENKSSEALATHQRKYQEKRGGNITSLDNVTKVNFADQEKWNPWRKASGTRTVAFIEETK